MTSPVTFVMIALITGILITGGFTMSPYAYSTGFYHDDDDDRHDRDDDDRHDRDDDDCEREKWSFGGGFGWKKHGDDDWHDDDRDDDDKCEPDPCDCKKPDSVTVIYNGPVVFEVDENGDPVVDEEGNNVELPVVIQVYKRERDIGESRRQLGSDINDVRNGDLVVISASMFGKDRLHPNTFFRVLQDTDQNPETPLEEIDVVRIHTSCSEPLYVGLVIEGKEGKVSLEIFAGERNGHSSIPSTDPQSCKDEQDEEPTPMAKITIKKVITTDNSDNTENPVTADDFTLTITNVETNEETEMINGWETEIPAGTYTLGETGPINYSFVLITGDDRCPSELGEEFIVKKETHLTCTIYNDDKFEEPETGVIFHHNSLEFSFDDDSFGDSCDNAGTMPCVEVANAQDGTILIVDEKVTSDTLIFLFSVIEKNKLSQERPEGQMGVLAMSPLCTFSGVSPHDEAYAVLPGDPSDPGEFDNPVNNPSGQLGFAFTCTLADITGTYNVNYALIETVAP